MIKDHLSDTCVFHILHSFFFFFVFSNIGFDGIREIVRSILKKETNKKKPKKKTLAENVFRQKSVGVCFEVSKRLKAKGQVSGELFHTHQKDDKFNCA